MSTPSSTIKICSGVRLSNDYIHTIYFDSLSKQRQYFESKVVKTFSHYTYLRKSWEINVDATLEQARQWGYLFFTNPDTLKTYYYFITNIEYVNDSTVKLTIEMDVMQTYMFNVDGSEGYTLNRCFVEREHSSSDGIGDNTVEETLNVGDLRVVNGENVDLNDLCVLILSTYNPLTTNETNTDTVLAARYNGVFSGLGVYAISMSDWDAWGTKLKLLDKAGKSDGIISMWMYPKALVTLEDGETWENSAVCKRVRQATTITKAMSINTQTAGGYTPKNKKLLTYPYNFLYITNNNGGASVFKYERFGDPSHCNFNIVGSLSPEGAIKMYPLNYNGYQHNYDEGMTLSGFPTCAWNQDVYKLWLAQNQNQHNLSMMTSALTLTAGIGVMAVGGVTANVPTLMGGFATASHGASSIASHVAQKKDMAIQPPQAKGQHSANVNVVAGFQTFTIQRKSITEEYARIIDDYFTMYGYQTNRVKTPSRNVRENFTYTKTVNCHVTGNLCTDDLLKIQSIYDNGITFWVNGDSIGDYSLSNLPKG